MSQQSLLASQITNVPAAGETGSITVNYQVLDDAGNPVQTNVQILQVSVFFDSTQVALTGQLTDTLDGAGDFVVNPLLVDAGFDDISVNADGQPIADVSADDDNGDGDDATDSVAVFNFFDFGEDLPFGADGIGDETTVELFELFLPTVAGFGGADGEGTSPINALVTDGTPADFDDPIAFDGDLAIEEPDAPPFFVNDPFTFAIDENSAAGTVVGTVEFDDPNAADVGNLTLAIEGLADGDGDGELAFTIDADGNITVNDADELDFEVIQAFDFDVTVTDPGGLSDTADVTVNLNDLDDNAAPVVGDNNVFVVDENTSVLNSPNGTVVGQIDVTDPDGDPLTFSLVEGSLADVDGDGVLAFAVSETGEITVTDEDELDFEGEEFTFDVEVSDGVLASTATIDIDLSDRPELLAPIAVDGVDVTPLDLGAGSAGEILSFTLLSQSTSVPLEAGVILFDADGNVVGVEEDADGNLLPSIVINNADLAELDEAEEALLLDNSAVILSTLASEGTDEDVSSTLGLEAITRTIDLSAILGPDLLGPVSAGFFFTEGTSIANITDVEDPGDDAVFFGDEIVAVAEVEGVDDQFQIDFGSNFSLLATFEEGAAPVGTGGLQGADGEELVDLFELEGTFIGQVTTNISEAAFANLIGFIAAGNEDGGIDVNGDGDFDDEGDFLVADFDDDAYLTAALANVAGVDTDGDGVAEDGLVGIDAGSGTDASFIFEGGSFFVPFIVANGAGMGLADLQAVIDEPDDGAPVDGDVIAFGAVGSNPDGADHVRLLGDNIFGFEDLINTGDADFNDAIIGLNITAAPAPVA